MIPVFQKPELIFDFIFSYISRNVKLCIAEIKNSGAANGGRVIGSGSSGFFLSF